jgi:poly-gamma-glutamate synthesis protein (capsule biosynthesis protein)
LGVAFTAGETVAESFVPDAADLARHQATLAAARPATRLLVASIHTHHWPPDWADPAAATPDWLRAVARAFIEAGADLVLGHGPPVVLPPETWRDGLILPGLGNLVFHSDRQGVRAMPQAWRSVVARATFRDRRLSGLHLDAIALGGAAAQADPAAGREAPEPWRDAAAEAFLSRFRLTSGFHDV